MTDTGTCAEMCKSNQCDRGPYCETPATDCAIAYDGNLRLCLPMCDPLVPAGCPPQHSCQRAEAGFFCLP